MAGVWGEGWGEGTRRPWALHFSWLQTRVRISVWGGLGHGSGLAARVGSCLGQQGCIPGQVLP